MRLRAAETLHFAASSAPIPLASDVANARGWRASRRERDEVIDHFQQLAHDPNCPDRLDVLLDLSEETTIPQSREL